MHYILVISKREIFKIPFSFNDVIFENFWNYQENSSVNHVCKSGRVRVELEKRFGPEIGPKMRSKLINSHHFSVSSS